MLSDEWLSRYGLLENFNASVTRKRTRTGTRTGTGTGTWTTGVTAIALCTSCSRAKNQKRLSILHGHVNIVMLNEDSNISALGGKIVTVHCKTGEINYI